MTRHIGMAVMLLVATIGLSNCAPDMPGVSAPTATVQRTAVAGQPEPTPTALPELPGQIELEFDITATGAVRAFQDAEIAFQTGGTVNEIYVEEGDQVQAGELLAILDVRRLEQSIRNAEAALQSAQAQLEGLEPTGEQIRQAEAGLQQARGQLNQAQGAVTPQDVNAAQQQINQAQATLNDVLAGPDEVDIRAASAQRDAALAGLETQRVQLSQAKTQAEIAVARATNQVWAAQSNYSNAYWNWRDSEDFDPELDLPEAIPVDFDLGIDISDNISGFFSDQLLQAIVQLRQANLALEEAQLGYEQAGLAEIAGLQQAEAQVNQAQAQLDQLLQPPEESQVAQARAAVANAQANLAKLTGRQREGQIQAAQGGVAQAQANLDRLLTTPTESQQAQAAAGIAQAEAALAQAQLNREYAEIRAPFDGEVAVVNIDPGDVVAAGGPAREPAIRLVDMSRLYVDVFVNEALIDRVEVGQPVQIVADAIAGQVFTGTVTFIAPSAEIQQGVTTYQVRIELDEAPEPLRVGMTVVANIAGVEAAEADVISGDPQMNDEEVEEDAEEMNSNLDTTEEETP
ncbi:MAG: HlyD family secretion protein [Chloroflexaceae bacterium]